MINMHFNLFSPPLPYLISVDLHYTCFPQNVVGILSYALFYWSPHASFIILGCHLNFYVVFFLFRSKLCFSLFFVRVRVGFKP